MTQPSPHQPQIHAKGIPLPDDSEYMAMANQHAVKAPGLSQQKQAVGNNYTDQPPAVESQKIPRSSVSGRPMHPRGALPNIGRLNLQPNPSYGHRGQVAGVQDNSPPPPLPPKPSPKSPPPMNVSPRPPVGAQLRAHPSRPPVGVQQGAHPPRPPVGVQQGAHLPRPPVGGQQGVHHPRPPVGGQQGVHHPRPPVGAQQGAHHPRPPVGAQQGEHLPRPPVGGQQGVHHPRPPVHILPQQPHPNISLAGKTVLESDSPAHEYTYIHATTKEQQIHFLQSRVSDLESKLKEKDLELSRCNDELSKRWQCLTEKKEEIKQKNLEIQRLRDENEALRQTSRANPQVARTDAALQAQVTHYKKMVDDLSITIEQLRRHPPVPANDMHEIGRLRGEVQWNQGERQRMMRELEILKSSEAVLSAQIGTYKEDFASERRDRERAHAIIEELKQERDSLNHIITLLGGQQQVQDVRPP